jgi:glycosyltransferase involved in cell wall biosynthesis
MKIGVIGTRGFPNVQGGLETHCMELYPRIASQNDNMVTIYRRTPYLNSGNRNVIYKNVRFIDFRVPKNKYLETFLHSLFSTVHSLFQGYDIIHFHNGGPGFFIPLMRLTKAKIVLTYHNISYTQKKWNSFAKTFLRLSERISITNADFVIFISEVVESIIVKKYHINKYKLIYNGVNIPVISSNKEYIESLGLEKHKYVLAVGRYLEEKGFDYLIRAFTKANIKDYKLVLVGDTDYPTNYSDKLKLFALENNIILTGFIKGEYLNQIYSNARLFIMPSFEEGLPIALLEAMSFKLDVLASDIPAHLQIGLRVDDYFSVGNEDALKKSMLTKLSIFEERDYGEILTAKFMWDTIAKETNNVYKEATL